MPSYDYAGGISATTYMAAQMWKSYIYLNMMKESFEKIDAERDFLAQNGTWLVRTDSLARYARFSTYA